MSKLNFMVFIIILGLIAIVVDMAKQGNPWAIGILFSIGTVILVGTGAGIVLLTNRQHNVQSSKEFQANMKENLLLMQTLAKAQGEQNKALTRQVQEQPKQLPPASQLIIDDSIFNGLTD